MEQRGVEKAQGRRERRRLFAEIGFGHNERNLQTKDAVDGDVLGYVY